MCLEATADLDRLRRAARFDTQPDGREPHEHPLGQRVPVPPNVSMPLRTTMRPTGWLIWMPTEPSAWVTTLSKADLYAIIPESVFMVSNGG